MFGIIYKVTCIINNKIYIGQTIKTLSHRKAAHRFMSKKGDRRNTFQCAILDEGFNNFIFEQIDTAITQDELNEKEKYWIAFYKSNDKKFGFNTFEGGKNSKHTEETKKKISIGNTGKVSFWRGKHLPKETCDKISISHKGKKLSDEHKLKIKTSYKGMKDKKHSDKSKKKISKALKKLNEKDIEYIRNALINGETGVSLAKRFNVSTGTITNIKQGKYY